MTALGKRAEVVGVAPANVVDLPGCQQSLGSELADRVEHHQSSAVRAGDPDQAVVEERPEAVEDARVQSRRADRLGSVERPASAESGQPCEQPLGVGLEEVVRPVDRGAQRLLAAEGRWPPDQQVEPGIEPLWISSGSRSFARPAASSIARGRPSS